MDLCRANVDVVYPVFMAYSIATPPGENVVANSMWQTAIMMVRIIPFLQGLEQKIPSRRSM